MLRTKGTAVLLACAIALMGAACSGRRLAGPPLPDSAHITQPAPDVPAALAAFSGTWRGYWGGDLESLLVVERISRTGDAAGIYAWGADPGGEFKEGNMTFQGRIANGVLTFGTQVRFDFTMKKDGSLAGRRIIDGTPDDDVVMTKMQ